jgi:peptidoglycan/LPS O-acetylase OafA/YrhL
MMFLWQIYPTFAMYLSRLMSKETASTSKVFFPNLDGLRTIAFLMVFIQHAILPSFNHLSVKGTFWETILMFIGNGANGVSIFFVLSGFLITYLILSEKELTGKLNVPYFYIRRTLRIWPLYYAVIIFAFIVYPYAKHLVGMETNLGSRPWYYFVFLSNFDVINIEKHFNGSDAMSGNITWSVAIEEQFYLLWPLLFYILPKRLYQWIFMSVIALALVFRYYYINDVAFLYFHSLSVCADLALGGLCAYYALYSAGFRKFFENTPRYLVVLFYVAGICWIAYGISTFRFPNAAVVTRLISTLFFAFIILEQNYSKHSFYKFSKSRVLTFWGKYTYGLYLLHPIALTIVDVTCRWLGIPYEATFLSSLLAGFISLAISLLMSYISYEYFESWFLKLKKKFSFVKSAH